MSSFGRLYQPRFESCKTKTAVLKGAAVTLTSKYVTEDEVEALNAATEIPHAFAVDAYAAGETGNFYRPGGDAWGLAGAAIALNDFLKINASGEVIPATAGDKVVGRALMAAADAALVRFFFFEGSI